MRLAYSDRASSDLESAFAWYERQRRGLGFEFLDCVEVAIKNIIEFPESYPVVHAPFHRCLVRRFPFSLFYTVSADLIVVHAVFDNRQDPVKQP